ncbi:MAG: carbohydrate kinase family protein [Dehalococcoidales bacterium]
MNKIEVVGLGALNIDHICKVERILEDGETVVKEAGLFPGGSAANTIYGLAKLGVNTGFVGVVGDDAEGELLRQDFQKVGVDTSQIRVKPEMKTGSVLCLSDKLGRRSLYVLPGANSWLTLDELDLNYISRAKILHFSSLADDRQFSMLLELIERLDLSVKLSFAPGALYAAKKLKALSPILSRAYLVFLNQNEIMQLTEQEVIAGAENCLKQGSQVVVVTLGKGMKLGLGKGTSRRTVTAITYIRNAEREYAIEADKQNIASEIDATGAGDAFATGFLYGLLREKSLEECGRLGNIVARFSVTKTGARQGLPTLNQLAQHYQQLYSKRL